MCVNKENTSLGFYCQFETVNLLLLCSNSHNDIHPAGGLYLRRIGFEHQHTFAQHFGNTIAQFS